MGFIVGAADVLVAMLVTNKKSARKALDLVGVDGFEPPTLCL
jgi:hypothetical protein